MGYQKIDDVREEILGLKLVDYLEGGNVLFFVDEEGRDYSIDFTGKNGAVVNRGSTPKENQENDSILLNLLIQKLGIDVQELWELYE